MVQSLLIVNPKPIDVIDQGSDGRNSEYESVDGDELGEEEEEEEEIAEIEKAAEVQVSEKPLDDDEDRKNPQYIPKKGTFYEHDDRTIEEIEEMARDAKSPERVNEIDEKKVDPKKKVWREDDKWQHDRFEFQDQSPKSKDELVAAYGYDIRNEECAPRARRRRRYGRGPNKYTRNWEDLDAYSKPTTPRGGREGGPLPVGRGRGKRTGNIESEEDFPSLQSRGPVKEQKYRSKSDHLNNIPSTTESITPSVETEKTVNNISNIHNENQRTTNASRQPMDENRRQETHRGGRSFVNKRGGGSRGISNKMSPRNHNNVNESAPPYNNNRYIDRRGGGGLGRGRGSSASDRAKDVADITEGLKTVTITQSHKDEQFFSKSKRGGMDNRRTIPPRMQDSMKGTKSPDVNNGTSKPKRYSSQRQRTTQDQVVYQQPGTQFYDQTNNEPGFQPTIYEGGSGSPGSHAPAVPPAFVPPSFTTTPAAYSPEPFLGRPPAPRMTTIVTQPHLIGPAGAIATAPVPVPVATGAPTVVAAAPITGPPFLPPENMINFAAGAPTLVPAPHPNPQFTAAAFQAFTPVSQTPPPQEIYSNGTMYYNTQSQHFPRINPNFMKRPKAAIPIVPPPDNLQGGEYQQQEYEEYYEDDEEYDDSQEYFCEEGMEQREYEQPQDGRREACAIQESNVSPQHDESEVVADGEQLLETVPNQIPVVEDSPETEVPIVINESERPQSPEDASEIRNTSELTTETEQITENNPQTQIEISNSTLDNVEESSAIDDNNKEDSSLVNKEDSSLVNKEEESALNITQESSKQIPVPDLPTIESNEESSNTTDILAKDTSNIENSSTVPDSS